MGANDEKALVDAALAGDARASRALVEALLPTIQARVTRTLMRYKRSATTEQVVDDLTQQIFVMLFENSGRRLRAWEPERGLSLAGFVALIAEREAIAILRRTRRNPWTESPTEDDELATRVGSAADHEAQLASRELLDTVLDRAMAKMSERDLVLFQRLVVDEAEVEIVAREMAMTVNALYMWRSRFTKLVRDLGADAAKEPSSLMPRPIAPLRGRAQ
jgi:RNA polymerase sigma-70 factor (ECF subfamily)